MNSTLLVLNDMRAAGGVVRSDLNPSDRARATNAFSSVLRHARAENWLVAHVMRERGETCRPVLGLEPLRTEHVFLLKGGERPNFQRLRSAVVGGLHTLVLASLNLDEACAALVREGLDLGVRVLVVAEAGDMGDGAALIELSAAGARIAPAADIIAGPSGEVVWLRDFLERSAGRGGNDGV